MRKTREYQALFHTCKQEGCPLCRLVQASTERYLNAWKYELFTDVGIRAELQRSQGFCSPHTWQLARMGARLQLAQAYRDIVSDMVDQLKGNGNVVTPSTGKLLGRLFDAKREQPACPACIRQERAEAGYIHTLRNALFDEEFYQQFLNTQGLCLRHFRLACELKLSDTPGDWLSLLRKAQLTCLQRLDEALGEMIRKHDYRFRDEERGEEMMSWRRAASFVAGEEVRDSQENEA